MAATWTWMGAASHNTRKPMAAQYRREHVPRQSRRGDRPSRARRGRSCRVSKPRGAAGQPHFALIAPDGNHPTDDVVRADRRIAPGHGVAAKMEGAAAVARADADEPVRQHTLVVSAEQYVAADDVAGGDGCDRDRVAVADRGIHARAFGAEPDNRAGRQRFFHHDAEQAGISHTSQWRKGSSRGHGFSRAETASATLKGRPTSNLAFIEAAR